MNILKVIFLFLAVMMTISNIGKLIYKSNIDAGSVIWQSIGIVGFVVIQFNLI